MAHYHWFWKANAQMIFLFLKKMSYMRPILVTLKFVNNLETNNKPYVA